MREAITAIRKRKGQDWNKVWSAGSFFKNLLLTEEEFGILRTRVATDFGEARGKELDDLKGRFSEYGKIKIPVAYLLDKVLNLRGLSEGGAKLSDKQIINIVNTSNATSRDVYELYKKVRDTASEKLGITLINEPDLIGFDEI
jgi:UDP-N-acetylmuramate dehydrogenase